MSSTEILRRISWLESIADRAEHRADDWLALRLRLRIEQLFCRLYTERSST